MLAILRVCLHCQKINPTNVGRVVYCISRPYTFGRRSRDHQLGAYLRPLLFATTVCSGSFAISILYQHGWRWTEHSNSLKKVHRLWNDFQNKLLLGMRWMNHNKTFTKVRWLWEDFAKLVNQNKMFFGILSANTLVFYLWRVRPLYPFMKRYFLSSTRKEDSTMSMLLSCFSHVRIWHITINMVVLYSFMPTLEYTVGKDLVIPFYLSAGVFASLVSHYCRLMRRNFVPSLGASGAIMGVMTLVITKWPNIHLTFILFPFVMIPGLWGLGGIVMLDMIGLIRGWKTFDHAAHLGGVIFAILYDKVFSSGVLRLKKIIKELLPPPK